MSSILNTDLGDLYDQWNQCIAFNEVYDRQEVKVMNEFAYDAISKGIDRATAREQFLSIGLNNNVKDSSSYDLSKDPDLSRSAMSFNPEDTDGKWTDADGVFPLDASGNDFYDTYGNPAVMEYRRKKRAAQIEPITEVTDGEETLGMESVVANETEDISDADDSDDVDLVGWQNEMDADTWYEMTGER